MTRTSIWDLREMQRGPVSPRKPSAQPPPPPIGSPRLARGNHQNRRLSTIGRLAIRERPHVGYGLMPPRIGEGSSGRLWPGHFSQAANTSVIESSRIVSRKGVEGGGNNSARGLGRSSSVPRTHRNVLSSSRPPAVPGSLSAVAISVDTGKVIATANGCTHAVPIVESHGDYPHVHSPSSLSAPGVSTALEADLGMEAESWEAPGRNTEPVTFAERVENLLDGSVRGMYSGNSMFRAESADAVMAAQYRVPEAPISRRPPPLDSVYYNPGSNMSFQEQDSVQDELVIYIEAPADNTSQAPGLGSIQPNGRAQVLQACCSSTCRAYPPNDGIGQHKGSAPRPLEAMRSLLRQTPMGSGNSNSDAFETEWSTLSEAARNALKQWSTGQLGGRHCMLIVGHSSGLEFNMGVDDEPAASSLRSGAALNVLAGLQAEVDLFGHSDGSWLFQNVFSKQPANVLEEAIGAAVDEINDPRIDGPGGLSSEQANLALRRLAMKVQCLTPHVRPSTAGKPRISDEYLRTQVWLELLRLCVEGGKEGLSAQAAKDKDKLAKGEKPPPGWNDIGVLRDLGKTEPDLELESEKMSLEALRVQNRHIEEYVMRLVRQRDELKSLTKFAEERDSYVILGLEGPESTEEEVKKAYRALARKEHPDKAGIGNKRRFQQIQQAYSSILRQIREGGSSAIARSPGAKETSRSSFEAPSPVVDEALAHGKRAREAADRVAVFAHRTIKSSEDSTETHRDNKRRALRVLRDMTKHGIVDLRGAADQLRILGEAVCGIAKCAEAAMDEQKDAADKMVAGVGLRDRAIIVDDAGRSCATSAELLEKISEATEATLRKVEKADTAPAGQEMNSALTRAKRDEASQLLHLGIRLLSESLTRTAAVARRSAEEAISATTKAHELSRGLVAVDVEGRKERAKAAAKQRGFDDDDDVVIAADDPTAHPSDTANAEQTKDESDDTSKRTPPPKPDQLNPQPTPRDQLKSAAKRVKERHVALRVKNLRFLSSLNEESLRLQARLREMLERSEGALLPEVSIVQKRQIFDLVAQLLDFAVAELGRIVSSPNCLTVGPMKVLERVLSFGIALEHSKEVAMPVESRTQALKIAALIDCDLLCQIISGPLRTRLINAAGRRNRGEGTLGSHMRLKTRSHSIGAVGGDVNAKAWEEAVNACCSRVVVCLRNLHVPDPA